MLLVTVLLFSVMGNLNNYYFQHCYRYQQLNMAHYKLKLLIDAVAIWPDSQPREGGGMTRQPHKWWWLAKVEYEFVSQSEAVLSLHTAPASQKLVTQTELNAMMGRYVAENMLPLSTAGTHSLRALIGKILWRAGAGPPCRKTFSKYTDADYTKINAELKRGKKKK